MREAAMLPGSEGVAGCELVKYDYLVERIAELEAEQVETQLRPAESKLRGLQQTLASYERTLAGLHAVAEERHAATDRVTGAFDFLGRKHKQRRVAVKREAEAQACREEAAQAERVARLAALIAQQRAAVLELRAKTRELDAVRQAEADLVERLFRADGLALEPGHSALETAVCSLAPRIFQMREAVATSAVVLASLESAAHQVRDATERLEVAWEPGHRTLTDAHGDATGEEWFDPADARAKRSAARTADSLARAAAQNLGRARLRLPVMPAPAASALSSCVQPLLTHLPEVGSDETRRLARDCINALYVARHQIDHAVESVAGESACVRRQLEQLEQSLGSSREQLDSHRRRLLSQLQQAKRAYSLRWSEASGSDATGLEQELRARFARRLGGALGGKVPSVNSGLSRLG